MGLANIPMAVEQIGNAFGFAEKDIMKVFKFHAAEPQIKDAPLDAKQ